MVKITIDISTFAAFTVLVLVAGLLDGNRRPFAGRLGTDSTPDDLSGDPLEHLLDIDARLGTGLAEGKLVFVG